MQEVLILIVSVVAGISTYLVSHTLKRGAVIASAIVTLVSGFIFPHFFPTIGGVLAAAGACASYAGMISLQNALNLFEMSMISLMTGTLFILASIAYSGIGGRLGTTAAIACFAWLGIKKILGKIKQSSDAKELAKN